MYFFRSHLTPTHRYFFACKKKYIYVYHTKNMGLHQAKSNILTPFILALAMHFKVGLLVCRGVSIVILFRDV